MEKTIKNNAGLISFLTAIIFALLLYFYNVSDYSQQSTYIIMAGIGFILLDTLILWIISTNKVIKKKGKKGKK